MNTESITKTKIPDLIEDSESFQDIAAHVRQEYGLQLKMNRDEAWSIPSASQKICMSSDDELFNMIGEIWIESFVITAEVVYEGEVIFSQVLSSTQPDGYLSAVREMIEPIMAKNIGEVAFEGDPDNSKLLAIMFNDEKQHLLLQPGDRLVLVIERDEEEEPKPAAKATKKSGGLKPPRSRKRATKKKIPSE